MHTKSENEGAETPNWIGHRIWDHGIQCKKQMMQASEKQKGKHTVQAKQVDAKGGDERQELPSKKKQSRCQGTNGEKVSTNTEWTREAL